MDYSYTFNHMAEAWAPPPTTGPAPGFHYNRTPTIPQVESHASGLNQNTKLHHFSAQSKIHPSVAHPSVAYPTNGAHTHQNNHHNYPQEYVSYPQSTHPQSVPQHLLRKQSLPQASSHKDLHHDPHNCQPLSAHYFRIEPVLPLAPMSNKSRSPSQISICPPVPPKSKERLVRQTQQHQLYFDHQLNYIHESPDRKSAARAPQFVQRNLSPSSLSTMDSMAHSYQTQDSSFTDKLNCPKTRDKLQPHPTANCSILNSAAQTSSHPAVLPVQTARSDHKESPMHVDSAAAAEQLRKAAYHQSHLSAHQITPTSSTPPLQSPTKRRPNNGPTTEPPSTLPPSPPRYRSSKQAVAPERNLDPPSRPLTPVVELKDMLAKSKWFGDFNVDTKDTSSNNRVSTSTANSNEFSCDYSISLNTLDTAGGPPSMTNSRCASDATTNTHTLDSVLNTPEITYASILDVPPHIRTVDNAMASADIDDESLYSDYNDPSMHSYSHLQAPPIPDSPAIKVPNKRPSLSNLISHIHGPKLWYKKSLKKLRGDRKSE